jgi:hypothetical protein
VSATREGERRLEVSPRRSEAESRLTGWRQRGPLTRLLGERRHGGSVTRREVQSRDEERGGA